MTSVHKSFSSKSRYCQITLVMEKERKVLHINGSATGQTAKSTFEQEVFWRWRILFYYLGASV